MFTGIIEEIGRISRIYSSREGRRLVIEASKILADLKVGDSVAINGACLTVVECMSTGFLVEVSPETLSRTTLGRLRPAEEVNLERALRVGDRLGGHQVMGHIDGIGKIGYREGRGDFLDLFIKAPPEIMRYVVPKGSIAVDGISLTVAHCDREGFWVAIVPYTARMTTIAKKRIGDEVNLEADIIGKYVEHLLREAQWYQSLDKTSRIDQEFLAEHGFL